MTETQSFLIDVLNLVPEGAVCFIQAPSCDNPKMLKLMQPSKFDYYTQVPLTSATKQQLINLVNNEHAEQQFHNIEIRLNDKLLFEAFDGMEVGSVSQDLQLPTAFICKYIQTGMCTVSASW
jgi:hypothetical protein